MKTITGKLSFDEYINILELNGEVYTAKSGFIFKRSDNLDEALKNKVKYLSRITFMTVKSYNTGEISFIYEKDLVYFTIFNIENTFETYFKEKGFNFKYILKSKEFILNDEKELTYINKKYKGQAKLRYAILDEIDSLMTNETNQINLKETLIDNENIPHTFEFRGAFLNENEIKFSVYDITKQEELNLKALQAEKLQSLGYMAGEIAHELNNQLMAIDGNVELAIKDLKLRRYEFLENVLDTSLKSKMLIKSLLTFSNEKLNEHNDFSLEELINDFELKAKLLKNKNFQFIKNIDVNTERIHLTGSLSLLSQMFLNLYNNALESFEKDENVLILNMRVIFLNSLPKYAINNKHHVSGKYLKIDFIDNGVGIKYEDKKRIFDPFYTTKGRENNTGLGLTQSLASVIKHDGIVELCGNQMEGTTVSLYLPCKEDNRQLSFDFNLDKTKILVVDDDKTVLVVLEGLLKEMKYEVIGVVDPFEAKAIYTSNYKNIDLVVSDMLMPKMNGEELYYELKAINSNIKFILLSGYLNNVKSLPFLNEISSYIEKPIRKKELERELRKTLK